MCFDCMSLSGLGKEEEHQVMRSPSHEVPLHRLNKLFMFYSSFAKYFAYVVFFL